MVIVAGLVGLGLQHPAPSDGVAVATGHPTALAVAPTQGPAIAPTLEPPEPWDWQQVDVPLLSQTSMVREMWVVGGSFIALADDFGGSGGPASALLISRDGTEWTELTLPAEGLSVAAGTIVQGDLWLAGSTGRSEGRRWQLWSTDDGTAWVDRGAATGLVPGNGVLMDIEGTGSGFVATVASPPVDQEHPGLEQVRYSHDGRTWKGASIPDLDANSHLVGLTAAGDGWLLGQDLGDDPASYELRILASSDGRSWSSTDVAGPGEGLAVTLAAGPGGYILGGAEPRGDAIRPVVWTSLDGSRWSKVGLDVPQGSDGTVITHALSTSAGFVVFGDRAGDAWASIDGTGAWWYRDVLPPGIAGFLGGFAARGDTLVAGGASDAGTAILWRGSLSSLGR